MFDTTLVLWLQERASPASTALMWAVTFCGYAPACLAIAVACGFGWRLRLGLSLVLAILFADAMTVVAKGAFASPRPHAVDARVRTFSAAGSDLSRLAMGTAVPADDFGFPSGHVATTAAWALGLAWLRRKRWQLAAAATWIALMALSRMYLGRHFPADVLGGLVVGLVGLALARLALPPAADRDGPTTGTRMALGLSLIAVVALATLFRAGLGAHDAGRFCGLLAAVLLLLATRALDDAGPRSTRIARAAVALVLLGVALWSSTWPLGVPPSLAVLSTMAVSAALHAGVLLVPARALGGSRS
jgi:membrane-associated phospholipid phosphatase